MEEIGQCNASWGRHIIDQLIAQGVDYFCLAPGFRCTPLALAIAQHPRAKHFVHFDERGLGFHALGYAKATGRAAAIIVTSGTALGNLYPAVMEASLTHTPMVLLTADRPAALRETMANQTCDQIKFFGSYVGYTFDLPTPTLQIPPHFLAKTVAQAAFRARSGPVHLNCPFPEPFFGKKESFFQPQDPCFYGETESFATAPCIKEWAHRLNDAENGVIILGALAHPSSYRGVEALAQRLGWPILPDIISSYRQLGRRSHMVRYFDTILKALPNQRADLILHIGNQCVSKVMNNWVAAHAGKPILHASPFPERCDPHHIVTHRLVSDPLALCTELLPHLPQREGGWVHEWLDYSKSVEEKLESFFPEDGPINEINLVLQLKPFLEPGRGLFLANSMPIRDADRFLFPEQPCGPIFASRGLSGIDGNIATCAGIAQEMPLIALIGDQTALHDLNSLAQLKKTRHRVSLIVINNAGGGIFSFVAIPEIADTFFANPHPFNFEKAAALFDIPYSTVQRSDELIHCLEEERTQLIEIKTDRAENVALHRTIEEELCSFSYTGS